MARDLQVNILAPSDKFEAGVKRMEASARQLHASELRLIATEERLEKLRATGKASAGQLASAQASVISAQDKVAKAQGTTAAATEQAGRRSSKAFASVGTAASAMGGAVGLGAAAAGVAVVAFARSTVSAASDMQEQMSATKTIFKDAADAVLAFGDSASAIGVSKTAALEAANSFGDLFTKIGYSTSAAATFSEDLVRVAADFASFKNLDPGEALDKLRSGLAGESEPLRSLGVFLTEAKVAAEGMRLGLQNASGELDEGGKVAARYSLILGQMGEAQGDVARTADSYANTQRRFAAETDNLKASIGSGLLPVLTDLAQIATNVTESLSTAEKSAGSGGDWKADVEGWLDHLDVWEKIPGALDAMAGGSDKAKEATDDYADSREALASKEARVREQVELSAKEVEKQQAALESASPAVRSYAEELGLGADAIKEVDDQLSGWGETLAGFVNPLGAYTGKLEEKNAAERASAEETAAGTESSKDSWEDFFTAQSVGFDEYIAELQAQVEAQQDWSSNMLLLAGRVSQGTLDELAKMGPEGAPLIADMVTKTDAELAQLEPLFAARSKNAVDAQAVQWRQWGVLAPQLTAKIGKDAVAGLARELEAGTTTVADISRRYAFELAGGITPLLRAVGKNGITESIIKRDVAMMNVQRRASGGPVWGEGTATSDSIPALLSNGEYVIRADSVARYGHDFLDAVNQGRYALGGLVRRFAAGGLAGPPRTSPPFGPPVSTGADATMARAYAEAVAFQAANAVSTSDGPASVAGDGELASNAVSLKRLVLGQVGQMTVGGWGRRPNATEHDDMIGGRKASRALDFMTTNLALGNRIAQIAEGFAGTKYLIWQRQIWKPGEKKRPYNGRSPHTDHVHASVFSKGGPVRRMAAGGPLARATAAPTVRVSDGSRVSAGFFGKTLTDAVGGLLDPAAIRAAAQAWEDNADALERNQELTTALVRAQRELVLARGTSDKEVAEAKKVMQSDLKAAKTKADRVEAYKKYDAVVRKGAEARSAAYKNIAQAQEAIADQKREDALDRERKAVDKLVESLEEQAQAEQEAQRAREEALEAAQRTYDDALSRLDGLLDRERDINAERAEVQQQHAEKVVAIARRRAEAEASLTAGSAAAAADLVRQQQDLLDGRRLQLEGWARLDERAERQWGNSVDQLLANARDQAAQFEQWLASLAEVRARGVSEQVIAALGLDEGPQALGQLRQFGQATAAQIDALNAEVARRTALAGAQTSREQQDRLGELGRDLVLAQEQYAGALAELQQRFVEEQAALDEELVQAQAELLVRQAELETELAALGQDQARSYGEALEKGLRSQIPAVLAAAQALQAAAAGVAAATAPTSMPAVSKPGGNIGYGGGWSPGNTSAPGGFTYRYDSGGWLKPNSLGVNTTGRPEAVLTPAESANFKALVQAPRAGTTLVVQINGPVFGVDDLHRQIRAGATALLTEQRTVGAVTGAR